MMFVGRPISDIQATDLNQEVLLSLFQDAFRKGSRAEIREERQDVKTDHTGSHYTSLSLLRPFSNNRTQESRVARVTEWRRLFSRGVIRLCPMKNSS